MSTESPEDYELFHYGVKGMKWGVRKRSGSSGRVGSTVNKVRTKIRERDESIIDARNKVANANREDARLRKEYRAEKKAIKSGTSDKAARRAAIRAARSRSLDERNEHAKVWLENYSRSKQKTSKEILVSTAYQVGVTAAPGLSRAMANKRAADITTKTARKFAEAHTQANPRPSIMSPNTISLNPDDSRWG